MHTALQTSCLSFSRKVEKYVNIVKQTCRAAVTVCQKVRVCCHRSKQFASQKTLGSSLVALNTYSLRLLCQAGACDARCHGGVCVLGGNQRRSLGEVVEPPAVKFFKSTSAQHVWDESSLPGGGVRTGWPLEFPFSPTSFFLTYAQVQRVDALCELSSQRAQPKPGQTFLGCWKLLMKRSEKQNDSTMVIINSFCAEYQKLQGVLN